MIVGCQHGWLRRIGYDRGGFELATIRGIIWSLRPFLVRILLYLDSGPASAGTVTTLIGYEQLVGAAMVSAGAEDGTAIADMLAVLQSRGAIEQAKGAIMGRQACDADTAWATLRRASHESNVKLRSLAVALVEHISGSPAEQPALGSPIVPTDQARHAAGLLWAVLTHDSTPIEPAS